MQPNEQTVAVLAGAYKTLWEYRAKLEKVWPTPETRDAFRFAGTEAGEAGAAMQLQAMVLASEFAFFGEAIMLSFSEATQALDYQLRENARYARNRERTGAVLEELADCAMMLLTALPPDGFDFAEALGTDYWLQPCNSLEDVVQQTGYLVGYTARPNPDWTWVNRATAALVRDIAILVGLNDFAGLLAARLERIARKVGLADAVQA